MKKILFSIISMVFVYSFIAMPVFAKEEVFYTNKNGVEMTHEQYNKLSKNYSEEKIAKMNETEFNFEMTHELKSVSSTTKYIIEDITYNTLTNEVISVINREVSKEEFDRFNYEKNNEDLASPNGYVTHDTASKSLTLDVYYYTSSVVKIEEIVYWLVEPKVRSYDVLAVRWELGTGSSYKVDTYNGAQIDGFEFDGGKSQDYVPGGSNSKQASNGIGISMNIFDTLNSGGVELRLNVYGKLTGEMAVYGSYQHATSNVTLAQSKDYTFSASGLGKVIKFNSSSIKSRYDNMQGVVTTISE